VGNEMMRLSRRAISLNALYELRMTIRRTRGAVVDEAKSIVQSSNGDLHDKVWKLLGIAEAVLILTGVIVVGQER
jgi:ElaB/YqjD/DUF883 family membrane-anchored ribosome-binding protein